MIYLTRLTVMNISQYIQISNRYITPGINIMLYVNYILIKKRPTKKVIPLNCMRE